MRTIMSLVILVVAVIAAPRLASASECWEVSGWYSSPPNGTVASVTSIPCTHTPLNKRWLRVVDTQPLWLRIDVTDPHITSPGVFDGYVLQWGTSTAPVFVHRTPYSTSLGTSSPEQATPVHGMLGRLRHVNTRRCIRPNAADGGAVVSDYCEPLPAFTYKLIDAGNGKWRLASHPTSKCLYVVQPAVNGGTIRNWGCWPDPNFTFELEQINGGSFLLRHQLSNPDQCPYDAGNGVVNHAVCAYDDDMYYRFDAL